MTLQMYFDIYFELHKGGNSFATFFAVCSILPVTKYLVSEAGVLKNVICLNMIKIYSFHTLFSAM